MGLENQPQMLNDQDLKCDATNIQTPDTNLVTKMIKLLEILKLMRGCEFGMFKSEGK